MAYRSNDASFLQFGSKLLRAFELGSKAPAGKVRTSVKDFQIFFRTRVAQVTRVLCSGKYRVEIWTLKVHSAKSRSFGILLHCLSVCIERGKKQLVGTCQRRRIKKSRAVDGMHPCGSQIGLDRTVHEVRSAGSMRMHVDETRADIASPGIYDLGICRNILTVWSDVTYDSVSNDDIAGETLSSGDDRTVLYFQSLHLSLLFRDPVLNLMAVRSVEYQVQETWHQYPVSCLKTYAVRQCSIYEGQYRIAAQSHHEQ